MVGLSSYALGPTLHLEPTLQPHTGIDTDSKTSHTCPQSPPCPFVTCTRLSANNQEVPWSSQNADLLDSKPWCCSLFKC